MDSGGDTTGDDLYNSAAEVNKLMENGVRPQLETCVGRNKGKVTHQGTRSDGLLADAATLYFEIFDNSVVELVITLFLCSCENERLASVEIALEFFRRSGPLSRAIDQVCGSILGPVLVNSSIEKTVLVSPM